MSDSPYRQHHGQHMDELESLVRELIENDFDRVALAKTLSIVDEYLFSAPPMSKQVLEAMLQKLFYYWVEIDDLTEYRDELAALRTMSPAELKALQWFDQCHDCGDRAYVQLHEEYFLPNEVWHQACAAAPVMENDEGKLCVGCLEKRLGRQLCPDDFGNPKMPEFYEAVMRSMSVRLYERLRGAETPNTVDQITTEEQTVN
jgi:hypothetical protein